MSVTESVQAEPTPPSTAGGRFSFPTSSRDWARWAFLIYLVAAIPILLAFGSSRWFLGDEWSFLAARSATNLHDLFAPYNQHWSTIPLISYRIMFHLFGLHEYWPYQLLVILAHLGAAGLLRVIMRRCGVGPWLATVVAGTYVLFGPGSDDILWAFQIGFTLSLVFGFSQMILSDHPGGIDRRDWAGLAMGGLALLTSGNAPPLILATGIAVLWRRGWRQAAFHTVPLGLIYGIWYLLAGASLQDIGKANGVTIPKPNVGDVTHFLWTSARGTFRSLGHFPVLGAALVVLLVVGLVVAWQAASPASRPRRFAMPVGLALATVISVTITATQRFWLSPDEGEASRYLGITAAFLLPLLALAADGLVRRWRALTPVVFALFLLPLPWTAAELRPSGTLDASFYRSQRDYITELPTYPGFSRIPGWVKPNAQSSLGMPNMTIGWLRQAVRQGQVPAPAGPLNFVSLGIDTVQLGVAQRGGPAPAGLTCRQYDAPLPVSPRQGEVWRLESPLQVSLANKAGKPASLAETYTPLHTEPLVEITLPKLDLLLSPAAGQRSFRLCR